MKIFDCFIYSDEEMLLDIRLNTLSEYIDKFIIVEANYKHNGDKKKKNFDIKKFKKFEDKIHYIFIDNTPNNLNIINKSDDKDVIDSKQIRNSIILEHHQRNMINEGLFSASENDIVIISDVDEIPILNEVDFEKNKKKLIYFKQKMFYYKFNLLYQNFDWIGSKACRKSLFNSPQWLRDTKNKQYPFWRIDTYFNKRKYNNVHIIENGGWHFTQIKSSKDIFSKLSTFAHHVDFKESGLGLDDISKAVKEKKILYDHSADKTKQDNKWIAKNSLTTIEIKELPKYIIRNQVKFKDWIDN